MRIRLTRNSYKRKLVMFGVSIFMSLSMTATGFASWVLSQDVTQTQEGEVHVGAVTETNIGIENISFIDDVKNFAFEPQEEDVYGRVRNDGENFENMTVQLSWMLTNVESVGTHTVTMKVHEHIKAAIDAGYITMPAGFALAAETETVKINDTDQIYYTATYSIDLDKVKTNEPLDNFITHEYNAEQQTATFTLTLTFGWGAVFGNQNPGIYYDTHDEGKLVEYDVVKQTLNTLKATVHGVTYDEYVAAVENENPTVLATLLENNPIYNYYIDLKATVA